MADDPTLKHFRLEPYAAVLTELAQQHEPKVLMMGASRAAIDAGWIPYARQAGQTGKTVQIVRLVNHQCQTYHLLDPYP